jgi:hypothetical protein
VQPYKVIILPEARDDIEIAAGWYERQESDLGVAFIESVKRTVQRVRHTPFLEIRYDAIRFIKVIHFPYFVHFRVIEENLTI